MIIVIYGNPGTGKTRNAAQFQRRFGCLRVLDFGERGKLDRCDPASIARLNPRDGDLILTTARPEEVRRGLPGHRFRAIPIAEALKKIGGAA